MFEFCTCIQDDLIVVYFLLYMTVVCSVSIPIDCYWFAVVVRKVYDIASSLDVCTMVVCCCILYKIWRFILSQLTCESLVQNATHHCAHIKRTSHIINCTNDNNQSIIKQTDDKILNKEYFNYNKILNKEYFNYI